MGDGRHGGNQSCSARYRIAMQQAVYFLCLVLLHWIFKAGENLASGGGEEVLLRHRPPPCWEWGSTSMLWVSGEYGQNLNLWILCQACSEDWSGEIFLLFPQFVFDPSFPDFGSGCVCSPRFSLEWPHSNKYVAFSSLSGLGQRSYAKSCKYSPSSVCLPEIRPLSAWGSAGDVNLGVCLA